MIDNKVLKPRLRQRSNTHTHTVWSNEQYFSMLKQQHRQCGRSNASFESANQAVFWL